MEFLVNLFVKTDGKQLRCSFICILMNYPAAEDRQWDAVVARISLSLAKYPVRSKGTEVARRLGAVRPLTSGE